MFGSGPNMVSCRLFTNFDTTTDTSDETSQGTSLNVEQRNKRDDYKDY